MKKVYLKIYHLGLQFFFAVLFIDFNIFISSSTFR